MNAKQSHKKTAELIKQVLHHPEFLLLINEGQDDQQTVTLGQYIRANDEHEQDDLTHILTIGLMKVGEYRLILHDTIKRIN